MTQPKLTQEEAFALIKPLEIPEPVKLIGVRGYYKKTMGNPVKNDRNIYDDAMFIVSPDIFSSYNANTDPSVARNGVAVLKPGIYYYVPGLHGISGKHPYPALRQASNVTVTRDGGTEETDSPAKRFWINIHRGGFNSTSSLGCQTIYPNQWASFINTVYDQMKRHNQKKIPYILIAND